MPTRQLQHASVARQFGQKGGTSPLTISPRKLMMSSPVSRQPGHARTRRTSSPGSSLPGRRDIDEPGSTAAGGKEDGRPDEEGQPAASIDIIGQARPAASHRPLSGRLRALGSTASSGHGSTAASSGHDISALSVEPGRAFTPGQEHLRRLLNTEKEEQTTTHPPSEPSEPVSVMPPGTVMPVSGSPLRDTRGGAKVSITCASRWR